MNRRERMNRRKHTHSSCTVESENSEKKSGFIEGENYIVLLPKTLIFTL